jgi:chromosome segregation ATPase
MIERVKRRLRPAAQQKVDNLVGSLYVREEVLEAAVDELSRMLANRFDAEAEVNAIIGQRVAALVAAVEALREEVQALRREVAAQRVHKLEGGAGEDRAERTWSHGV